MKYEIQAAHLTRPSEWQGIMIVEINDDYGFIDELIDLMNEDNMRDCAYKATDCRRMKESR